jgi:alpha-L-fucosidase 2
VYERGVSFEQQVIWDLFTHTSEAAQTLGVDGEFRGVLDAKRAKLLGPKIGKWGQLQEWRTDRDNPGDKHRHISHLFALHPGEQITRRGTPELAEAVRVSLRARGDDSTGWSTAWKINQWARLGDGDHAHKLFAYLIRTCGGTQMANEGGGLYGNLLDACPPFQIDGNFGFTAGVCEMLLQSHTGEIELLPALPKAWPEGKVTGLRARGNFTVDITWKAGKVTDYRIASPEPREVKVRVNGELKTVRSQTAN